ncbi:MAG: hypothetical protein ER33_07130 [Cyanobium sp. CACIAM 14]|nr:MAG: hypothetical protein ER33_07130 [Cyanobium sp. CACIAM 14]
MQTRRRRGVVLTPAGTARMAAARQGLAEQAGTGHRPSQEWLAELSGLSVRTVARVMAAQAPVDLHSLAALFRACGLELTPGDYRNPDALAEGRSEVTIDWGEAPPLTTFHGRAQELATLRSWISPGGACRLISVLGLGGIGKTTLVTHLLHELAGSADPPEGAAGFHTIVWRSLRNAPSLDTLLSDWIPRLPPERPEGTLLDRFQRLIRERRCLFVLDNFETVLDPGRAGCFRPGSEAYGELLRLFTDTAHRSLLILTSRERPLQLEGLEGGEQGVRSLRLGGSVEAARGLLADGTLRGSADDRRTLAVRCGDSPLAVKIIAAAVAELFGGDIPAFLDQDAILVGGLRALLETQFARLSDLERTLMAWLAIRRTWTSAAELASDLVPAVSRSRVLEALQALQRRCLVEVKGERFSQQPVVMEFAGERLIGTIAEAIAGSGDPRPLHAFALLTTTAADHVRASQVALLLAGVAMELRAQLGTRRAVIEALRRALTRLQTAAARPGEPVEPSHAAGNLLNLLHHLQADLTELNLAGLAIRHAYLPNVPLQHSDLSHADLTGSVLTKTFGAVFAVASHPDGRRFATGEITGSLKLWDLHQDQPLWSLKAAPQWIWSLAFSPDGGLLAVAGGETAVGLWDVADGRRLRRLEGHGDQVYAVCFDPTGEWLATACGDGTVRLWRPGDGELLQEWKAHDGPVAALAFGPGGERLVTGGADGCLRIWNGAGGEPAATLRADRQGVRSLAVGPCGGWIACGGTEGVIRLWSLADRRLVLNLSGHQADVMSLAFSPDGRVLASSSSDHTVRLWEWPGGRPLAVFSGHAGWSRRVCFSSDGHSLLAGSSDAAVRQWAVPGGTLQRQWLGYSNWMWSTDYSPDGRWILSGGGDRNVRLWDAASGALRRTLGAGEGWALAACFDSTGAWIAAVGGESIQLWEAASGNPGHRCRGHRGEILTLEFSPVEPLLASGGGDASVRLWDPASGAARTVLRGHRDWVRSLAFDGRGERIATASHDGTVRLWDVATGETVLLLDRFDAWVWGVAFTPDGEHLVSASRTDLVLWDLRQHKPVRTFRGHSRWIRSIHVSRDGRALASGGSDGLVHLWDLASGERLVSCEGHTDQILSVRFRPDGERLISGSADETLRVWERASGRELRTLQPEGLYAGTRIPGVSGLSPSALDTLRALGARED